MTPTQRLASIPAHIATSVKIELEEATSVEVRKALESLARLLVLDLGLHTDAAKERFWLRCGLDRNGFLQ